MLATLDFHVFDINDFDVLIGYPIEIIFLQTPSLGTLDFELREQTSQFPSPEQRTP
jgi:hypothetical protein